MKKDLDKNIKIYKISDLMAKINVTARTIRYYDSEGLLGDVKRSVGYTRYFTDADLKRLREIIRLKKKGHKIADIKSMFESKYNQKTTNKFPNICLSDVFLNEDEVSLAQQLDIEIAPTVIKIKSVKTPYYQWPAIESSLQTDSYELQAIKTSNRKYQWTIPEKVKGIGNSPRSIFNFIAKNHDKDWCNEDQILNITKQSFEWLVLPIEISLDRHQPQDQYFFVKYYSDGKYIENIWKKSTLISNMEKQIKEAISPFNGVMNQVTIHANKKDKTSLSLIKSLQAFFPNPLVLNIEDVKPYHQHITGSNQAILLSII